MNRIIMASAFTCLQLPPEPGQFGQHPQRPDGVTPFDICNFRSGQWQENNGIWGDLILEPRMATSDLHHCPSAGKTGKILSILLILSN